MNKIEECKSLESLKKLLLKPTGWLESKHKKLPVDAKNSPLPWWTYPSIEFIASIVHKDMKVFEYGCGYSTLWWASNVLQVISVEHDKHWARKISKSISLPNIVQYVGFNQEAPNQAIKQAQLYFNIHRRTNFNYDESKVIRRGLDDEHFIAYADEINRYPGSFDCIVIDGMARRLCAYFAAAKLSENGFIVFDNSNRSDYLEGYQYLVDQGFYQLRFSGMVPGADFPSCTSVFIKSLKCLQEVVFSQSLFGIPEY